MRDWEKVDIPDSVKKMASYNVRSQSDSEKQVSDAESSLCTYIRNKVRVEESLSDGEKFARELWSKMRRLPKNKLLVLKTFTVMALESVICVLGEETAIGSTYRGHVIVIGSAVSRQPFEIGRLRRGVYCGIIDCLVPIEMRRNWPSRNGFFTFD